MIPPRKGWNLIRLRILLPMLLVGAAGLPAPLWACSCVAERGTHQQQVQIALNSADVVLVAKVRQAKQWVDNSAGWPATTEDTQFVVLEVLKGHDQFFVGQPLVSRNMVSRGTCGVPVRNEPGWMMAVQDGKDVPVQFSDTWLIYAYGSEPFELSMCTRSLPLNIVNAQRDLTLLRKLLNKVPAKHPQWEEAAFAGPKPHPSTSSADKPR